MKRVAYLDDLRALATVAVVVIHVASNNWYGFVGTPDWVAFTVYAALCKFCVPVFFMISGALFLDRAKQLDVKRLYCHNILKLAVFLVVWSFIYQIFHIVESGSPVTAEALLVAVKNVLRGNTQTHFWFIYAMIGIYIVSPIIKVFTDNASKRMLEYFLVLWLVLQSFFDSLVQIPIIAPVFHNIDKMMIQVTASYLGFFVLGHYLAEYGFGAKRRHASYTLGAVGIIVSLVITIYMSMRQGVAQETCFGYFFPGIVFYSAAIFIWFRSAIGNGAERESAGGGADSVSETTRFYDIKIFVGDIRGSYAIRLRSMGYGIRYLPPSRSDLCAPDLRCGASFVACADLASLEGAFYQYVFDVKTRSSTPS